jgi:hypothetical protein
MHNPYDLHSWSKLYREDVFREARVRHLADRARPNNRASVGVGLFQFFREGALALLLRGISTNQGVIIVKGSLGATEAGDP